MTLVVSTCEQAGRAAGAGGQHGPPVARLHGVGALPGGFAARYAGDEFILVQLVDSEEEITAVAQELRQRTEAFNRTHRRPYHLSFSMGCSLWRPGENLDTFLRHMDERMYAEKRAKSLPR